MKRKAEKARPITPPELPDPTNEILTRLDELEDGGQYLNVEISETELPDQVAERVYIDTAVFRQVAMSGAKLELLKLTDVLFDHCDLNNSKWYKANLNRVQATGSRLTGLEVADAKLSDVLIKECKCDFVQFRASVFKYCRFEACNLREADFSEADLSGVAFVNCDLRGAQMYGTRLKGADLRGSQLDDLQILPENLRGAIVEPAQLITLGWGFAKYFGLVVNDAEDQPER